MAYVLVHSFHAVDVMVELIDNPNGTGETIVETENPPTDTVYNYLSSYRIAVVDRTSGATTVIAEDVTSYNVDTDGFILLFKAPLDQLQAIHEEIAGHTESRLFDIRGSIAVYDVYEARLEQISADADFALGRVGGRITYRGVDQAGAVGDYDLLRFWVDTNSDPQFLLDGETVESNRSLEAFTYENLDRDIRLFSRFNDEVSFNGLTGTQPLAIAQGANPLDAGDGDDTVVLPGNASFAAAAGFAVDSWFYGGRGDDTITGGGLGDRIDGGAHDDEISGGSGRDWLEGGAGEDLLSGDSNNDRLSGGTQDDVLDGGRGDDELDGGAGADRMTGGAGRDTYFVSSSLDQVVETTVSSFAGHRDKVFSAISNYTLGANVEDLELLASAINGRGNAGANAIVGNLLANRIEGDAGNDDLDGGAGDDVLVGGLGRDLLTGGEGEDRFDFDLVEESIVGPRRDVVMFSSADGDRVDLGDIDAGEVAGDQDFAWVNDADLGAAFTRAAGQLRFADGVLMGDVDGDGRADFHIGIVGSLAAGDVLL